MINSYNLITKRKKPPNSKLEGFPLAITSPIHILSSLYHDFP